MMAVFISRLIFWLSGNTQGSQSLDLALKRVTRLLYSVPCVKCCLWPCLTSRGFLSGGDMILAAEDHEKHKQTDTQKPVGIFNPYMLTPHIAVCLS